MHKATKRLLILILATAFGYSHATVRFGSYDSAITLNNNVTFDVTKSFTNKKGDIRQRDNAALIGDTIYFDKGSLEQSLAPIIITGHYHPDVSGTGTIELHGTQAHPQTFRADSGTLVTLLQVQGDGNRIEGFPLFENPIQFLDKNTTVTIAIGSVLNQNINLNGGTIILEENLDLADGVSLTGPGTIKLNDRRLSFGSKDLVLTSSLYWIGAADLYLNGRVDLSGSWTFEGECYFNGDSTILNLLPGGDLTIRENSSLNLRETKIKGLGFEPGEGRIWFADPGIEGSPDVLSTSKLRLRRAALELTTTYTFDRGHVIAEIGSNQIITRENTLFFEKPGHLTVDGINLFYKTRTFTDNNNIKPLEFNTANSPIEIIREGDILHYRTFNTVRSSFSDFNEGTDNQNTYIGVGHEKVIGPGAITVDSNGWYWHFARNKTGLLSLENNTDLEFRNIVLKDFQFSKNTNINQANSNLILSQGCVIELAEDTPLRYLTGEDAKITVAGSPIIDGRRHSIFFFDDSEFILKFSSAITFKNATLVNLKSSSFSREVPSSGVIFLSNCDLLLDESISLEYYTEITGNVRVYSLNNTPVSLIIPFGSVLDLNSDATLHLGPNVTIRFENGSGLKLERSSTLSLDEATLEVTSGDSLPDFRQGTLRIQNKCFIKSGAPDLSEAIILGNGTEAHRDLRVEIMPGGSLELLSGIVDYKNITG